MFCKVQSGVGLSCFCRFLVFLPEVFNVLSFTLWKIELSLSDRHASAKWRDRGYPPGFRIVCRFRQQTARNPGVWIVQHAALLEYDCKDSKGNQPAVRELE